MVLEKVICELLDKHLNKFVDGFDAKKLNISVLQGDIVLNNLKLKEGLLESPDLVQLAPDIGLVPFVIAHGVLGRLEIKIPWGKLKSEPVIVEIRDAFIVAQPKKGAVWDAAKEVERQRVYKKSKLEEYEAQKIEQKDTIASSLKEKIFSENGTFVSRLIETIVSNLQIRVINVHVRLEDDTLDSKNPYVMGLTLESVSVVSTDKDWREQFIKSKKTTNFEYVYKLGLLKNCSAYIKIEDPKRIFSRQSHLTYNDLAKVLAPMIYEDNSNDPFAAVLKPTNGRMELTFKTDKCKADGPKVDVNVIMDEIGANFNNLQFQSVLSLIFYLISYDRIEQFRKFRPAVRPLENPIAWWRYAINSVVLSVQQQKDTFISLKNKSLGDLKQLDIATRSVSLTNKQKREKLSQYKELYKRKQKVPWLKRLEKHELVIFDQLEDEFNVDDLLFARKAADAEIKKEAEERAVTKELEAKMRKQAKAAKKRTAGDRLKSLLNHGNKNNKNRLQPHQPQLQPQQQHQPQLHPDANRAVVLSPQPAPTQNLPTPPKSASKMSKLKVLFGKKSAAKEKGANSPMMDSTSASLLADTLSTTSSDSSSSRSHVQQPLQDASLDAILQRGHQQQRSTSSIVTEDSSLTITGDDDDSSIASDDDELSSTTQTSALTDLDELDATLKDELFDMIGYKENEAKTSEAVMQEYSKVRIRFGLRKATGTLFDINPSTRLATMLAEAIVSDISVGVDIDGESLSVKIAVRDGEVFDRYNKNSQFQRIAYRRDNQDKRPLVSISVNRIPLEDDRQDFSIGLNVATLDAILNFSLAHKLISSFQIDPSHVDVQVLQEKAMKQLMTFKDKARQQLQIALTSNKTFEVSVGVESANLLIPVDPSVADSPLIIVDLGRLSVKTGDTTGRKRRLLEGKLIEKDFFDEYSVRLSDMQVLCVKHPTNYDWRSSVVQERQRLRMIEKFGLDVIVWRCLTPRNEDLDQIRIEAVLHAVNINCSPQKIEQILMLVQAVQPIIENPTGSVVLSGCLPVKRQHLDTKTYRRLPPSAQDRWLDRYWTERWVEVKSQKLYIHESTTTKSPVLGIIELNSRVQIVQQHGSRTSFAIQINESTTKNSGTDVQFWFRTENSTELQRWTETIRSHIISGSGPMTANSTGKHVVATPPSTPATPSTPSTPAPQSKQIIANISFTLDSLRLTMGREQSATDNSGTRVHVEEVVALQIEKLSAGAKVRAFDQTVSASLFNLSVRNLLDAPSFDILSTVPPEQLLSKQTSQTEPLFSVTFSRIVEGSPFFGTQEYEMLLDARVQNLCVYTDYATVSTMAALAIDDILPLFSALNAAKPAAPDHFNKTDLVTAMQTILTTDEQTDAILPTSFQQRQLIKVCVTVNSCSITLLDNPRDNSGILQRAHFATGSISAGSLNIAVHKNLEVDVQGSIGNLTVVDMSGFEPQNIVSVQGEAGDASTAKFLTFSFRQLAKSSETDNAKRTPMYTQFVSVHISSLQFLVLHRALIKIASYFTPLIVGPVFNAIKSASEKLKTAASEAIESKNIELVSINVAVSSPVIIIPFNDASDGTESPATPLKSSHRQCTVLNLGQINISNSIETRGEDENCVWLDKFQISVAKINMLSRLLQQPALPAVLNESTIINEFDLLLNFERAIINPLNQVPNIKVSAYITGVAISLSRMQYLAFFRLGTYIEADVKKSLSMKEEDGGLANLIEATKELAKLEKKQGPSQPRPISVSSPLVPLDTTPHPDLDLALKFASLSVLFLRGDGANSATDSILKFNLQHAAVEFTKATDESIKTSASIRSISIMDMRGMDKTCFDTIMRANAGSSTAHHAVEDTASVRFSYERKANKDQIVLVNLTDHDIFMVPDAIIEMKDFFDPEVPQQQQKTSRRKIAQPQLPQPQQPHTDPEEKIYKLLSQHATTFGTKLKLPVIPPFDGRFKLNATFGNVKVLIPEDSRSRNSRLLVFGFGAGLVVSKSNTDEGASLKVTKVTVYVQENIDSTAVAAIIEPLNLVFELHGETMPAQTGVPVFDRALKLEVDAIQTRISYQNIKLISLIAAKFSKPPQPRPSVSRSSSMDSSASTPTSPDTNSDFFTDNGEWAMTTSASANSLSSMGAVDEDEAPTPAEPLLIQNFKAVFHLNELNVLIVDDFSGSYDIPLLEFKIVDCNAGIYLANGICNVDAKLELGLNASFYNLKIAKWEPFIEDFTLLVQFARVPVKSQKEEMEFEHCTHKCKILSPTPLNVNITYEMLASLNKRMRLWQEGLNRKLTRSESQGRLAQKFYPYVIRNQTGDSLVYFKELPQGAVSSVIIVENSGEDGFDFPNSGASNSNDDMLKLKKRKVGLADAVDQYINVQMMSSDRQHRIRVNKVGIFPISFPSPQGANSRTICKIDIVLDSDGKKIITVRSSFKFVNRTTVPLALAARMPGSTDIEVIGIVDPGESLGIPFRFIKQGNLFIRPLRSSTPQSLKQFPSNVTAVVKYSKASMLNLEEVSDFLWNENDNKLSVQSIIQMIGEEPKIITCKPTQTSESQLAWHAIAHATAIDNNTNMPARKEVLSALSDDTLAYTDFTLEIVPPISIENLLGCAMVYDLFEHNKATGRDVLVSRAMLKRGEKSILYHISCNNTVKMRTSLLGANQLSKLESELFVLFSAEGTISAKEFMVNDPDPSKEFMPLMLKLDRKFNTKDAFRDISVFAPYWIVNKTNLVMHVHQHGHNKLPAGQPMLLPIALPESVPGGADEEEQEGDSVPLMLYSHNPGSQIAITIGNSISKTFKIDNIGMAGSVPLFSSEHKKNHTPQGHIGVEIAMAPGKFNRTKIITITPRYVVVNNMNESISFTNTHAQDRIYTLKPGEVCNYIWSSTNENESALWLKLRLNSTQYDWSQPVKIESIGEQYIKLVDRSARHLNPNDAIAQQRRPYLQYIAQVKVQQNQSMMYIVFEREHPKKPPYLIKNATNQNVVISQTGENNFWYCVHPKSSYNFAWDRSDKKHSLSLLIGTGPSVTNYAATRMKLDNLTKKEKSITLKNSSKIYLSIRTNGPTKILLISDRPMANPSANNKRQRWQQRAQQQQQPDEEETRRESIEIIDLKMRFAGIGISLVDNKRKPRELCYCFVSDIGVRFTMTNLDQKIEAKVGKLQLDNQLYEALYPVMVTNSKKLMDKPVIHVSIVRSIEDCSILFFNYFSVLIQEMDCAIEFGFITFLVDMFVALGKESAALRSRSNTEDDKRVTAQLRWRPNSYPKHKFLNKNLYFRLLELHPIKVNVTFTNNHSEEGSNNIAVALLNSLGVTIASIDNAPLRLNALILEHPFVSSNTLKDKLIAHYRTSAIRELYKVIGSVEVLGNPVGLFNDISTGVIDFFYEPAVGITKSPHDFAEGVAKGIKSLLKNSVHGAFNTTSKVTGSISKGVGMLSLDEDYIKSQHISSKTAPRHLGEGLLQGGMALGKGILHGVTGIITKPIEGSQKEGFSGFVKGIGKGIIGAPVKPIVGVLDLATKTTEGIKNTTTYFDKEVAKRTRHAHVFSEEDGQLLPYSYEASTGAHIVRTAASGRFHQEKHLYHVFVRAGKRVAVITDRHLIWLQANADGYKEIWSLRLEAITGMVVENNANSNNNARFSNVWVRVNYSSHQFQVKCDRNDDVVQIGARFQEFMELAKQYQQQQQQHRRHHRSSSIGSSQQQ